MTNLRARSIISLLRRLGKERAVLPIGGGLSVSLLELQALLFLIGCLICSCCSISSYVWGNVGLRRAKPVPVGTSRPARTPTHTPVAIGTPAAMSTDSDTPTMPPAETTTPTSTPRPREIPVIPATIQPPASTVTIQSPIPIPTLAPTPAQAPVPTDTPQPTPTAPTLTPAQTLTPTPTNTPTPTSTPSPTTAPSDLQIVHVEYGPDLEDEYVLIENRGAGSQDMTGWALYDEQWHAYFFPADFILLGGDSVRVWTKSVTDPGTDLYWGLDDPVWGNPDTAFLRDSRDVIDSLGWWP